MSILQDPFRPVHDGCDRRDTHGLPTCPSCLQAHNLRRRPGGWRLATLPLTPADHDTLVCGLEELGLPPTCPACHDAYVASQRSIARQRDLREWILLHGPDAVELWPTALDEQVLNSPPTDATDRT
jgi:hypothetical protein